MNASRPGAEAVEQTFPHEPALDRDAALDAVREIWRLARAVAATEHRDLAPRAAEITAMAHFMLYDADGGVEDDR